MQRRKLIKNLLTATLAAPLLAAGATRRSRAVPTLQFDDARWSPRNAARLEAIIANHGSGAEHYDHARRPYAVFDWDNTCIMNDCEEALFMYQIDHLAFEFTPQQFGQVLRQDVPAGPFKDDASCMTVDGKPVQMDDLADDIDADFAALHAARAAGATLDAMRATEAFQNFRAKLYFMYEAVCASHPIEIGYKWIIGFFANMTPLQLQALTLASTTRGLGDALRRVRYESARTVPGKSGVVAVTHFHGLRVNEEMRALMHVLRAKGIDVFVSTASLDDVVRVFAANPDFGYGVPLENVIGLRLEMRDGRYSSRYREGWHFNWGPGKTVGIRNVLGSRGDPLMVFGDSDGDAWMLQDFKATQLGLIVNRLKGGPIGALCGKAAASIGDADARFALQGRNEHTGLARPDERTVKYGQDVAQLLA